MSDNTLVQSFSFLSSCYHPDVCLEAFIDVSISLLK